MASGADDRHAASWTQLPEIWPESPSAAIIALYTWLEDAARHLHRRLQDRRARSDGGLGGPVGNVAPPGSQTDFQPGVETGFQRDVADLLTSLDRIPALLGAARELLGAWEASLADRGAPVGLYSAPGSRQTGSGGGQFWGEG